MIGTALDVAAVGTTALWLAADFYFGPAARIRDRIRQQWYDATDPLYRVNRLLPGVAALIGAYLLIVLLNALNAHLAAGLLMFGAPTYLGGKLLYRGYCGVRARIRAFFGRREEKKHPGDYVLPMDVEESSGAVSTWSDRVAVPSGKSFLALGATRSGKTEAVKHLLAQMDRAPADPTVVYDRKDDFRQFYQQRGVEYVRLSSDPGPEGSAVRDHTARWDLFRELEHGADPDTLARSLFPAGDSSGGGGTEFFGTAARQVFAAVVTYLSREYDLSDLHNGTVVSYFEQTDPETMYEDLTEYDDLTAKASAIDPEASRQATGVYATVQQRVSDLFVGDFAKKGDFAVREYMNDPQGRVMLLDYPEGKGDTVGPIFGFLVDEAIRAGLNAPDRDCRYVLDEFATLPTLRKIDDLVNVGAGKNCSAVLTLQSIGQLTDMMGEHRADAILSGLVTTLVLRVQDEESVRFARSRIGRKFEEYTRHTREQPSASGHGSTVVERETGVEEQHEFSEQALQQFNPGVGVLCRPDGWAFGYIRQLPDPDPRQQRRPATDPGHDAQQVEERAPQSDPPALPAADSSE